MITTVDMARIATRVIQWGKSGWPPTPQVIEIFATLCPHVTDDELTDAIEALGNAIQEHADEVRRYAQERRGEMLTLPGLPRGRGQ